MPTTLSSVPDPQDDPILATAADVRAYIGDMLSQLADLARGVGDRRLEASMRVLAVEVEAVRPHASTERRSPTP